MFLLAVSPDGLRRAAGGPGGVEVRESSGATAELRLPERQIDALQFAPNGRLWAASGAEVLGWDLPAAEPAARWSNTLSEVFTGKSNVPALAAGRRWVLAGGRDGAVRLVGAADGALHATWPLAHSGVRGLALNRGETTAAVGTDDGEVTLLEVPSGRVEARLPPHDRGVAALAFLGDELLASGGRDGRVRMTWWDGREAQELLTLRVAGAVHALAFSPDGRRLGVLVEGERAVRVWGLPALWERLDALTPATPLPPLPSSGVTVPGG